MVFFCSPPSLVNRSELGLVQVGVAADQVQDALAAILVCKDLSSNKYRLFDGPQIDAQGLCIGKHQRVHGLQLTLCPCPFAQGHGAGGFEGKEEVWPRARTRFMFSAEAYQLSASR